MKFGHCAVVAVYFFVKFVRSDSRCVTPNGEEASCAELSSCPILRDAYFSQDLTVKRFVSESRSSCVSSQGIFLVCCGTFGNFSTVNRNQQGSKSQESKRDLLPSKLYCGQQHWDDYFHENETDTSVDEFPWLLVVYRDDKRVKRAVEASISSGYRRPTRQVRLIAPYAAIKPLEEETNRCLGVLISNQYALTDGGCASENGMWVALGLHDQKKNVSCIKTKYGDDCSDPVINVTVAEQTLSPNKEILLLRLEMKVTYTDFVRPICLPFEESDRPKFGDVIMTSGWGLSYVNTDVKTNVKRRTLQGLAVNSECDDLLPQNEICALQQNSNDYICEVDQGGPIMYRYKENNWFVIGLVDKIRSVCVYFTVPGKFLTTELVDWIVENIRP